MGREFSLHELLVEASAAATKLGEFGSRGDRRRFSDDEVFQYRDQLPASVAGHAHHPRRDTDDA
jgi:hypothetical protein